MKVNEKYYVMASAMRENGTVPMSTSTAALAGFVVGAGSILVYLIGGLIFSQWSIANVFSNFTLNVISEFL
jgi:hypothetical protein